MDRKRIDNPTPNIAAAIWTGDYIRIQKRHMRLKVTHDENGKTHYDEAGQIWHEYEYLKVDWQSNNGTIRGRDFQNKPVWTSAPHVITIWKKGW